MEQNALVAAQRSSNLTAREIRERQRDAYLRMKREMDSAVKRLSETKHPPIDAHAIQRVPYLLRQHHLDPRTLSLVIPEADFLTFFAGWFSDRVKAEDLGSSIRFCDIEILRGVDTVIVWLSIPVIHPDRDALEAEG